MKILEEKELKESLGYIQKAAEASKKSICSVSKIGAVLVKDGKVIGEGFNGPIDKACHPCLLNALEKNVKTELCFAMHAEERAVVDALEKGNDPKGATLYSTYVKGDKHFSTEDSFCAHCSRTLLESGVEEVILPKEGEVASYGIHDFYDLSFDKFIKQKYIM